MSVFHLGIVIGIAIGICAASIVFFAAMDSRRHGE
jgi:MFS superfamily sulfate permease-like transporter